MKKHLLTLSILAALSACGGSDDNDSTTTQAPPEISGERTATATKAQIPNASGRIVVNDPNRGESLIFPETTVGTYGSFFINAAGEWTYTLDQQNAAVQALVSSDLPSLVEVPFMFTTVDGSTDSIAVTIDGIDVPATFGRQTSASVLFDTGTVSGTVTVTDPNPAEVGFEPDQVVVATFGTVTFDTDTGVWEYDLDETQPDAIALNYVGEVDTPPTLEDTFLLTSLDGTQGPVTITITGSELVPADIDSIPGAADEEPAEGEDPVLNPEVFVNINAPDAQGTLTITDPNFDQERFEVIENMTSTYGTYSIAENGDWTYTLNGELPAIIDHRGDGVTVPDVLMDEFTVSSVDGTNAVIPIIIEPLVGGNLTAEIGGTSSDSIFRINMPDNQTLVAGKMTLKVNYAASGTKDAQVIFFGRNFNADNKRTLAALTLKSDGRLMLIDGAGSRANFTLDQTHTPGEWFDIAFTWDATPETKNGGKTVISLSIDGEPITSPGGQISGEFFESLSIAAFIVDIGMRHMQVSTGADSGPVNVDDYVIYSDVAGTNQIYTQSFDDLAEGTVIDLDIQNSATTGTKVGPLAMP